jgi:AraC-like DNA-binding protein
VARSIFTAIIADTNHVMRWIILAGVVQSVFLAFFLVKSTRGNRQANWVLSLYFGVLGLFLLIPELIRSSVDQLPHLIATSFPLLFLIGPLLYTYTNTLISPRTDGIKGLLNFIPSLAVALYFVPFYIRNATSKLEYFDNIRASGVPNDLSVIWFAACVHIIVYQVLTYRKVSRYNNLTSFYYSKLDQVRVKWLENFSLLNSVVWLLYFIGSLLVFIGVERDSLGNIDRVFASILTVFIYYVSYTGLNNPEIFPGPYLPALEKLDAVKIKSSKDAEENARRIKELMENNKPYLQPDLSLTTMAVMLDMSPRMLSNIIHQEFQKNFFDFINYYRIQEAKKRLLDPANNHLTIAAIGIDSGFNSKSTFNDVFKKLEKTTPSAFKAKNQTSP